MGILNYTTTIAPEKSASEIQKILARHGAKRVVTEFEAGELDALAFEIDAPWGLAVFVLPARAEGVLAAMKKQYATGEIKLPSTKINIDQARRVAWRILKDWVEAQLALVESRQAEVAEVFLPYLKTPDGRPFYLATQQHLKALPEGKAS